MNSPERMPAETHKPFTGYLWGTLAVLTCPSSLPCWPAQPPVHSLSSIGSSRRSV